MCVCVLGFVVVKDTVSSGEQPAPIQDGRSTHVTFAPDVKTDLPGPLPLLRHLPPHDGRACVGSCPTLCTHTHTLSDGDS